MYKYLPYFAVLAIGLSSCAYSDEELKPEIQDCPEGQMFDIDLDQCVTSPVEEIPAEEDLQQE